MFIYNAFRVLFKSGPYFSPYSSFPDPPAIQPVAESGKIPVQLGLDTWTQTYQQRFAELIVRERDVAGQLPAQFAATYARHHEAVEWRTGSQRSPAIPTVTHATGCAWRPEHHVSD
jgi:hypothetical protein